MNEGDLNRLVYIANAPINDPWLDMLWERHKKECLTRINYYRFLYHLVRRLQPEVCIELGVEYGLASAHMAVAAMEYGGIVIGVDHNKHGTPADEISTHCSNYHYVLGDTVEAFPRVKEILGDKQIGVVYQDSGHHYLPSVTEWETYFPYLASGAAWVCDDIIPAFYDPKVDPPGKTMETYFDELPGKHYKFRDVLHYGNTIGVVLL